MKIEVREQLRRELQRQREELSALVRVMYSNGKVPDEQLQKLFDEFVIELQQLSDELHVPQQSVS